MKYILIVILHLSFISGYSQTSVYNCYGPPTIPDAAMSISSIIPEQCYEFNQATNYYKPSGLTKQYVAYGGIVVKENFEVGSSSGTEFVLKAINPNLDVAFFEPNNLWGIPKYEKMELGITLPLDVRTAINNFIDDENDPAGLNPFLEWDVKVVATFTHIGSGEEKKVNGFYYKGFERIVIPHSEGTDVLDYEGWGGEWSEEENNYPFRIRFAPPIVGEWECRIKLYTATDDITYPAFNFNVVSSGNPGYIAIGANNRYLVRGNETYIPYGPNFAWPKTYEKLNPQSYIDLRRMNIGGDSSGSVENHRKVTAPLQSFLNFEEHLADLASNGVNQFRYIMNPWAGDIEFEKMGNYYDRMHLASEIDRMVDYSKDLGLNIQFNMLIHYNLSINVYHIKNWDWAHRDEYKVWDGSKFASSPASWLGDHGYCYNSKNPTNPYYTSGVSNDPEDFFSDPELIKYYKQRVRYIIARWGYATNISMWELCSEVDLTGAAYSKSDTFGLTQTKYRRAPYRDGSNRNNNTDTLMLTEGASASVVADVFRDRVENWHKLISEYIKDDLEDDHLISPSYAAEILTPDETYQLNTIAVASENRYNGNTDPEFFHINSEYDVTGNPVRGFAKMESIGKPVIYSESGSVKPATCDQGLEFKRNIWMHAFSGLAMANDWDAWTSPNLWHNYQYLRDFIANEDLNGGNWVPGHKSATHNLDWERMESFSPLTFVDMVYLRSNNKKQAMGVVNNRTNNFKSLYGTTNPIIYDDTGAVKDVYCDNIIGDGGDNGVWSSGSYPGHVKYATFHSLSSTDYPVGVYLKTSSPTGPGIPYHVDFYSIDNPTSVIHSYDDHAHYTGYLPIKYPDLDLNNPLIAFKVNQISHARQQNNGNNDNNMKQWIVHPNPANSQLNLHYEIDLDKTTIVKMFTLTGQKLFEERVTEQNHVINTKGIENGIYYITMFVDEQYVESHKITIQH